MLCLPGCGGGDSTYPAGGRVTLPDGTPLDGGVVEFRTLENDPPVGARGLIHSAGTFQLPTYAPGAGALAGQHQALVVPKRPPRDQWNELQRSGRLKMIHPKYQRFSSSGLEFTVTPKPSENDFHITVEREE